MKHDKTSLGRRRFLKGTAAGAAAAGAAALAPSRASAQPQAPPSVSATPIMSRAAETQTPPAVEVLTEDRPGSNFMVDIMKSLGLEYICDFMISTMKSEPGRSSVRTSWS